MNCSNCTCAQPTTLHVRLEEDCGLALVTSLPPLRPPPPLTIFRPHLPLALSACRAVQRARVRHSVWALGTAAAAAPFVMIAQHYCFSNFESKRGRCSKTCSEKCCFGEACDERQVLSFRVTAAPHRIQLRQWELKGPLALCFTQGGLL